VYIYIAFTLALRTLNFYTKIKYTLTLNITYFDNSYILK